MKKFLCCCSVILILCLVAGCATQAPYDYTALKQHQPKSILVLPPHNETVEVNADHIFMSTITQPLVEKGYYVFPVGLMTEYLQNNGLPTVTAKEQIPFKQIREQTGADAVLFTAIKEWGQKYVVFNSVTVVRAELALLDTRTGELLWDGEAFASEDAQSSSSAGLAGVLISALVTQVMRMSIDMTPQVARRANTTVINHPQHGLLQGELFSTETAAKQA